jgi:DNA-binding MarR family transcriptional regulator
MSTTSLRAEQRETAERNFGFLVHDVARLMRTNYDRKMRQLGLTRSQWWVMTHLYFNEGISQTELSSILDIERATLGRLLDRLEAKGWLERRPHPSDRRVKRVYLTGEVELLMQTMRSMAAEVRGQALAGIPPQEQEQLLGLLAKVKGNMLSVALEGGSADADTDALGEVANG